jgi:membrane protein
MRIVLYWTVLTLGAVLFFAAVALLGAGTFFNVFMEKLPGGAEKFQNLGWLIQLFSFALLAVMLTLFYRVIPNTRVFWKAALIGGLVVGGLLLLNNVVAFLYLKRVYLERSLYGSLALPLVIMSGLYIFWLCVLTGGIVSYAIQNVHFRNSQAAWGSLTEAMRERLALVVFLTICRRFNECMPPVSVSMLGTLLKVPAQLLNECLNRLVSLQLVTALRPDVHGAATDYLYQPARPLNRITLYDFKTLDDNLGEDPVGSSLERIDPLVPRYTAALDKLGELEFFQQTVEQLLAQHPFDESRPPFAFGEKRRSK